MLISNIASEAQSSGNVISFIFIILICVAIIYFLIIKKVIKPIINYFKTKQEFYQAQTEHIRNEKDRL